MKARMAGALVVLLSAVVWAQGDSPMIRTPPGAQLVGAAEVDEIRALPEMSGTREGKQRAQAAKVVGVKAVDRVYTTDKGYQDMVKFFDDQFKSTGAVTQARIVTPSSTAWTIQKPDGKLANLVVRNTKPTSFELVEVAGESAELQVNPGGR